MCPPRLVSYRQCCSRSRRKTTSLNATEASSPVSQNCALAHWTSAMLIAMPTANNPRHEQNSATGEQAGDCGSGCPDKVAMGWVSPGERVGRTERACWRPIPDTPFDPLAGPILLLAPRAVNGSKPGAQAGRVALGLP